MSTEAERAARRAAQAAAGLAPAATPVAPPAPVSGPTTPPAAQEDPAPVGGPDSGPQARETLPTLAEVEEAAVVEALAEVEDARRRAREAIEADRDRREVKAPAGSAFLDAAGLMRSIRERGLYPPGGAKRTINLDLPADLAEDLKRIVDRNPGTNRNQVLRRLVEELVAGEGRRRPRDDR